MTRGWYCESTGMVFTQHDSPNPNFAGPPCWTEIALCDYPGCEAWHSCRGWSHEAAPQVSSESPRHNHPWPTSAAPEAGNPYSDIDYQVWIFIANGGIDDLDDDGIPLGLSFLLMQG